MKILCAKSGIQFNCDHFPAYLHAREVSHPIFSLSQKKLLSFIPKFFASELNEIDSYLLFLSLLDSTQLVEYRTAAKVTQSTSQIIYNNMEDLAQIIGAMNLITHPDLVFNRVAITPENNDLESIHYVIENWENQLNDFKEGYTSYYLRQDLNRREAALEKLIKSQHKEIQLATQIANWAEVAGSFPTFEIHTQFGTLSLSDYWKLIIRKCINTESMVTIPDSDLQELITHCEDNIEHGTIYSHTLMEMLRNATERKQNYFGFGNSTPFAILSSSDSLEKANIDLLIANAPTEEPRLQDYPSRFAWLKAKTNWTLARNSTKQIQNETGAY